MNYRNYRSIDLNDKMSEFQKQQKYADIFAKCFTGFTIFSGIIISIGMFYLLLLIMFPTKFVKYEPKHHTEKVVNNENIRIQNK